MSTKSTVTTTIYTSSKSDREALEKEIRDQHLHPHYDEAMLSSPEDIYLHHRHSSSHRHHRGGGGGEEDEEDEEEEGTGGGDEDASVLFSALRGLLDSGSHRLDSLEQLEEIMLMEVSTLRSIYAYYC